MNFLQIFKKKKGQDIVKPAKHQIKVVMLACQTGGSGKTCLAKSIMGEPFQQRTQITTSGYMTRQVQLNKQLYSLNIWDTNSHERFRAITAQFLRPQIYNCFIITANPRYFNMADFKTFLFWMLSANNDALIILCQSFSDVQQQKNQDLQIVKEIFKQQFKYFKVSAKTGENVKQLRRFILNYFHSVNDGLNQRYNPKYSANFVTKKQELASYVQQKLLKNICRLQRQNKIFRQKLQQLNVDSDQLVKQGLMPINKQNENKQNKDDVIENKFYNLKKEQQKTIQQIMKDQSSQIEQVDYHYYENSFFQNKQKKHLIEDIVQQQTNSKTIQLKHQCQKQPEQIEDQSKGLQRDSFEEIIRQAYPKQLSQQQLKKVQQFFKKQYASSRTSVFSQQSQKSLSEIIQEAFDI